MNIEKIHTTTKETLEARGIVFKNRKGGKYGY